MYIKICCALFLLALVACQAAPSSNENSINEAEPMFAKTDIKLEDSGTEKDRAKKSTFCIEVHEGRKQQVPCNPEYKIVQEVSKPVIIPIPIPAPVPVVQSNQPIIQQQKPQPQPLQVVVPQPAPQQPAPTPIINIVPPAPAPAPCNKPTIIQPPQPPIHTVHVVHPQSLPSIREPNKAQKLVQQSSMDFNYSQKPFALCKCPPEQPQTTFVQQNNCKRTGKEYECSCQSDRFIDLPYNINDGYYRMSDSGGAAFKSMHKSPMVSAEHDPSMMVAHSRFFAPEGAREAEERSHHRKHYIPVNFNLQFPIIPDNIPKYYQPQYYSSYPNLNSYTYPSSYTYGAYGIPVNYYDQQPSGSNVQDITVNAGGPFYGRESQHIDSISQPNDEVRTEAFSPDIIQRSNQNERKEITQTEKENTNKKTIPETKIL